MQQSSNAAKELNDRRSRNLGLARWELGHSRELDKRLGSINNKCDVSKMVTGRSSISETKARSIERQLAKPGGWLDRDHHELRNMKCEDYALFQALKELTMDQKDCLLKIVVSFQKPNG